MLSGFSEKQEQGNADDNKEAANERKEQQKIIRFEYSQNLSFNGITGKPQKQFGSVRGLSVGEASFY